MRLGITRTRRLMTALLIAWGASTTFARGEVILLLPHWTDQQQKRLEMVTEVKRLTGQSESLVRRVSRLTDLRITSVDARRIYLTWTDRDYEVTSDQGKLTDPPIDAFKNEPIELTLNDRGQLGELRNWETVRRLMLKVQDGVDAAALKAGRTEAQIKATRAAFESSLATEESVRAAWANREGVYFYFYGIKVPTDAPLESDRDLTLPVGGVLQAKARITAERVADDRDRVKFHFEMLVDPEQAAARVHVGLQELARQGGRDPSRVPKPRVEMIERIDAEADMLHGWVLSLNQYRKVYVSGSPIGQIQTASFKLQDMAQP